MGRTFRIRGHALALRGFASVGSHLALTDAIIEAFRRSSHRFIDGARAVIFIVASVALSIGLVMDKPTAKAWAAGLSSPTAGERHATIDMIESLGLRALPVLREVVATSSGDARSRALELIQIIGTRRLLRPTLVTLDLADTPLPEALRALRDSSGIPFVAEPEAEARRDAHKVTLKTTAPLAFLEALDRVGVAGGFRYDPTPGFLSPSKKGIGIRLPSYDGLSAPVSYSGPYRLVLTELERHRQVTQVRPPAEPAIREDFFVTLDVVAEPGVMIERNGPIRIQEAVDERGRDLKASSSLDPNGAWSYRQWGQDQSSTFSYRLPLRLPTNRGNTITKLRGYLPITAIIRTDELFASPLVGIEGKTLSGGGVSLGVSRASLAGTSGSLEISIKGESLPDFQSFAPGPRQTTLTTLRLGFTPDDHIRIEDADGNAYGTNSNGLAPPSPDGSMSYRVNLFANRQIGPPARIRYFGIAGVATEVPFDFRELPIP